MVAAVWVFVSSEVVANPDALATAPEKLLLAVGAVSVEEVSAVEVVEVAEVSCPAASANAGVGISASTKSMEKRLLSAFLIMLLIPSNLW